MGCLLKGGGGLYSRVVIGAVLLAAGSGSRMGNRPNSLIELGGVSLIRRQLIALSGAGVDEVADGERVDHLIERQVRLRPAQHDPHERAERVHLVGGQLVLAAHGKQRSA